MCYNITNKVIRGRTIGKDQQGANKRKRQIPESQPRTSVLLAKKSSAKGFINPKPSTKLYKLVKNDINIKDTYIADLQEFKILIDRTIAELKQQYLFTIVFILNSYLIFITLKVIIKIVQQNNG